MTNPTAIEVDAAIRSVLADLLGRGRAELRCAPDAEVFAGRLFALRHAEALGGSTREVRLAPGTVVTPLARDFAKQRGIAIRTVSASAVRNRPDDGEWGFALDQDSGAVAALRRTLLDDRDGWREVPASEIAAWVGSAGSRGAVLVTPESAVAVWAAHQYSKVRAAAVVDAESVARAIRHLGASLLVVEPAGQTIHSLRQICSTFRRAGAPTPPPGLRSPPRRGPVAGLDGHADRRGDRPGHALPRPPEPAKSPTGRHPADDPPSLARWLARSR